MLMELWLTQYGRNRVVRFLEAHKSYTSAKIAAELGLTLEAFAEIYNAEVPVQPEIRARLELLLAVWPFEKERMYASAREGAMSKTPESDARGSVPPENGRHPAV